LFDIGIPQRVVDGHDRPALNAESVFHAAVFERADDGCRAISDGRGVVVGLARRFGGRFLSCRFLVSFGV